MEKLNLKLEDLNLIFQKKGKINQQKFWNLKLIGVYS